MPTNVTPQYRKAEEAFRQATTTEDKIARMEEMIALLPKHKGTDHLFGDLKKRLARLRKELTQPGRKSRRGPTLEFSKEGAAQCILVGPPNSGKSSLLAALTKAQPQIAEYPFTTQAPQPGMIPFEDIQFQLVDCPPVVADAVPMHVPGLLRRADLALLVADLAADSLLEDLDAVLAALEERSVRLARDRVETDTPVASVPTLLLAAKSDAPDADVRLSLLRELYEARFPIYPLSCVTGQGVPELPSFLFNLLAIVRVYSKTPGHKPDYSHPFTIVTGQTVENVCSLVHKDFVANLKSARLWRGSADPVTVSRSEPLQDRDVIELHL